MGQAGGQAVGEAVGQAGGQTLLCLQLRYFFPHISYSYYVTFAWSCNV